MEDLGVQRPIVPSLPVLIQHGSEDPMLNPERSQHLLNTIFVRKKDKNILCSKTCGIDRILELGG